MKGSLAQRMDLWARFLVPFGSTLILVLVQGVPTHLPGFAAVAPMLPLGSIFYWSIFRAELLPGSLAFLLGLIEDVISGTPLGINSLIFVLAQGLTSSQRRFFLTKPFLVAWMGFAVMSTGALAIEWVLFHALFHAWVELRAVLFELVMTVSFYPLLSWILTRLQLTVLRRS